MNPLLDHANGVSELQRELGDDCPVITWARRDYKILPGSAVRRQDLAPGGFQLNADLRFVALVETFLSSSIANADDLQDAMQNTVFTYLGQNYKATSVSIAMGGLQVTVEANSAVQNA